MSDDANPDPLAKKPLKVQPKNAARRSKEEREALARTEAEAQEARARAAAAEHAAEIASRHQKYGAFDELRRDGRWARRGTFRGRGGFMETRERPRSPVPVQEESRAGASPQVKRGSGGRCGRRTSASGSGGARTGTKRKSTARNDPKIKKEGAETVTSSTPALKVSNKSEEPVEVSDEAEEMSYGPPVNVELLDVDGESENEGEGGRWQRMLPVHVKRAEHVDRKVGINTQASATTAAGIKREPGEDDEDGVATKEPSRRGKGKEKAVQFEDQVEVGTAERRKGRRKVIDLSDELDERERRFRDQELAILRNELGPRPPITTVEHSTDNANAEAADSARPDHKDNKVYLFQFPPVIPPLAPAGKHVKKEPEQDPQPRPQPKPNPAVKLEDEEIIVKEEEDEEAQKPKDQSKSDAARAFPPGRVGKMRVHRSGRVTMDWGGITMDVGMGMESSFYQTAMMVETGVQARDETGAEAKEGPGGEAISLGPVVGKFVVKPNMSDLMRTDDGNQSQTGEDEGESDGQSEARDDADDDEVEEINGLNGN